MDLHRKVALLTGGARMGSVVARALAERGCQVILTYRRSRQAADQAVRELQGQGHEALALQCDLSRESMVRKTVQKAVSKLGRLDIVVNLASIYGSTPLEKGDAARAWEENLSNNAEGAYLLSVAAAPALRRSGGGHMIHISDWTSASGRPRYKGFTPYYVSKAAVKALVESLALELAPEILVNGIAPGPILPPAGMSAKELKAVVDSTPLRHWGGAEAIAKAVVFLAESDFITGEVIRVDGGRHLY